VIRDSAPGFTEKALRIATSNGYQQLVPQYQRIRDSIPAE
jgi:hypothetical protein